MELKTKGHAGKNISKSVLILTNAGNTPEIRLTMSGEIKPRKDISSTTIRLTGSFKDEIKQTVTITPSKEIPFKITDIIKKNGENIRFELKEIEHHKPRWYQLTVYNTKKGQGWYTDKIFIKTDSTIIPELAIDVFGVIREDKK